MGCQADHAFKLNLNSVHCRSVLSSLCCLVTLSSRHSVLSSLCPLVTPFSHCSVLLSLCPLAPLSSCYSVLSLLHSLVALSSHPSVVCLSALCLFVPVPFVSPPHSSCLCGCTISYHLQDTGPWYCMYLTLTGPWSKSFPHSNGMSSVQLSSTYTPCSLILLLSRIMGMVFSTSSGVLGVAKFPASVSLVMRSYGIVWDGSFTPPPSHFGSWHILYVL